MFEKVEFPQEDRKLLNHVFFKINNLVTGRPVDSEREFYKHEFFNRMLRHYLSSCQLENGVQVEFGGKKALVKDYPALVILFRSVIETMTMFFVLFVEDQTEAALDFRYSCWRRHGLVTRQRFGTISEDQKAKIEEENAILKKLEEKIESSSKFSEFKKWQRDKFFSQGIWNFDSETELLVKMGFPREDIQNSYSYLSSHAHVESVGLMQVWQMEQEGIASKFITLVESQIILFLFYFVGMYLENRPPLQSELESTLVDRVIFWKKAATKSVSFG